MFGEKLMSDYSNEWKDCAGSQGHEMKDCGDFGMNIWESSEADDTYILATSNCNTVFTLQEVVGHKHLCTTWSPGYIVLGHFGPTRPHVSVSCTDGESFSEYSIYFLVIFSARSRSKPSWIIRFPTLDYCFAGQYVTSCERIAEGNTIWSTRAVVLQP